MNIGEARKKYREFFGHPAPRELNPFELIEKVNEAIKRQEDKKLKDQQEEEARQKVKEDREARKASRGTIETFLSASYQDLDEDEHHVKYLLRTCVGSIETAAKKKVEFIKNLNETPIYALEWADSLFEYETEASVAKKIIEVIGIGYSAEELRDYIRTNALSSSRCIGSRSTSECKNMCNILIAQAWSKFSYHLG